jgi:hypothetical protein
VIVTVPIVIGSIVSECVIASPSVSDHLLAVAHRRVLSDAPRILHSAAAAIIISSSSRMIARDIWWCDRRRSVAERTTRRNKRRPSEQRITTERSSSETIDLRKSGRMTDAANSRCPQ